MRHVLIGLLVLLAACDTAAIPAGVNSGTVKLTPWEDSVFQDVNAVRAQHGLAPLLLDAQVQQAAVLTTEAMDQLGTMSDSTGIFPGTPYPTLDDRLTAAGVTTGTGCQNQASGLDQPAAWDPGHLVLGWANAPSVAPACFLEAGTTQVGIAALHDSTTSMRWVALVTLAP